MWQLLKYVMVALALGLGGGQAAQAQQFANIGCNSYNPLETMFSDVCWSGMFPIRLAGATMVAGKSGTPADATNQVVCACGGKISEGKLPRVGFTIGFWAPSKIIDVTRKPYCMPSLGGISLPVADVSFLSSGSNKGRSDRREAFANWVMYSFPIVYMLRMIDDGACPTDGLTEFDVLQASPMFPNWNDVLGRYTTFINPEMLLFANLTATFAMPVDAVASTAGNPKNSLFWVAGAWGPTYPITGFFGNGVGQMNDTVAFTSLTAFRGLSLMHRLGFLSETIGNDNLCERHVRHIVRKDAYRWQMLAPSPEANGKPPGAPPPTQSSNQVTEVNPPQRFGSCTHPTGSSTSAWGVWRDVPVTGEDHSYLLFQWTDCCFGVTP